MRRWARHLVEEAWSWISAIWLQSVLSPWSLHHGCATESTTCRPNHQRNTFVTSTATWLPHSSLYLGISLDFISQVPLQHRGQMAMSCAWHLPVRGDQKDAHLHSHSFPFRQLDPRYGDQSDHDYSDKFQWNGRAKRQKCHCEENHPPTWNTTATHRQELNCVCGRAIIFWVLLVTAV